MRRSEKCLQRKLFAIIFCVMLNFPTWCINMQWFISVANIFEQIHAIKYSLFNDRMWDTKLNQGQLLQFYHRIQKPHDFLWTGWTVRHIPTLFVFKNNRYKDSKLINYATKMILTVMEGDHEQNSGNGDPLGSIMIHCNFKTIYICSIRNKC